MAAAAYVSSCEVPPLDGQPRATSSAFAVVRVLRQVDLDHGRERDHAALGHHFDAPCEHVGGAGGAWPWR